MRLPWRAQIKAVEAKPTLTELGVTGTSVFSGRLSEEDYNPDLRDDKAIVVYDKMRKSDGQVKAALLACELPLRAATWEVKPASDSATDIEVADFISYNLFEGMTITWDDVLRHILLIFPFGFSVFEKVFEIREGKVCWRKLAPRLPRSVIEFELDDEGGLKGITQGAFRGNTYERVSIPVAKLIVFVLEREGSNYRGQSLLRAAYKHWYYKDQLYRIDGMAAERHGLGIPLFQYPEPITEADKKVIGDIGERLHAHQKGYISLPTTYTFDVKGVMGQLHNILGSIEHHDIQITRSILAQFINLGSKEVGSYALSQDQSGFFLMALRAVGKLVCDTMNRYAIRQLVDYNFNVDAYPKLQVSGLEVRDIGSWGNVIANLVNAGVLLPDIAIEDELRRALRLPARRSPEARREETAVCAGQAEPSNKLRFTKERHLGIDKLLDQSVSDIIKATKQVQTKQIDNLVEQTVKLLERGQVDKLKDVDVRYKGELTTALARVLEMLYDKGQLDVREELG